MFTLMLGVTGPPQQEIKKKLNFWFLKENAN